MKLDDAHFVEQRLNTPQCIAVELAAVRAVAPLGPAPPIRQWLNDGLAERVLTRVRMPLLVVNDFISSDLAAALLIAPPQRFDLWSFIVADEHVDNGLNFVPAIKAQLA